MRSWLAVAALLAPAAAEARPITAGAGLGLTQAEINSSSDPDHTLSLWGRVGLSPVFALQLELARIDGADQNLQTRSGTLLGVVDLAKGRMVPVLVFGAGLAQGSAPSGDIDTHHLEAGLGLEYRSPDGFVLGADVRIGDRTIDSDSRVMIETLWSPAPTLAEGQYRSARVTFGVQF
jgi:hypothetical protein